MDVDGESLPAVTSSGLDILSLANWAKAADSRPIHHVEWAVKAKKTNGSSWIQTTRTPFKF